MGNCLKPSLAFGGKTHRTVGFHEDRPSGTFVSQTKPLAACQVPLGLGVCSWVSALVSCISLYPPVCLPGFCIGGLSCDFPSLPDLRVVDFSVHVAFYLLG